MQRPSRLRSRFLLTGLLGLLVAAVAVGDPFAAEPPAAPTPAKADAPLPTALTFVPHDAALFVHADAAALWTSDLAKTFRTADKAAFTSLEETVTKMFGAKVDELKTVTLFFPKFKTPEDAQKFGVVLTFSKAPDAKKLEAGFAGLLPKNTKLKVVSPSDAVAVVLVGLGEEYAKPQPADADGHLTSAIRAAAGGKHALVAGVTFASLPDELQRDDLPPQVRAFQPIFKSQAVVATLDLGKSLTLDVRVKTKRKATALDAEKSLAAVAKLITDELGRELPDLEKEAANSAPLKDLVKVFKAGLEAVKGAKYDVADNEARATVTLPLAGLPLAGAYQGAAQELRKATAVRASANNLKQIALAMHNYHDTFGNLPPAAVCDKKAKPQLSWRVLILPYVEQDNLYKQFKLDEPWDSENNKKLLAKMPPVYALPGKSKPGDTDTHYRVFVGNGAGWDWVMGGKIAQIADGTSNTLMVVTAADAVPWTKPDELEFDPEKDMTKLIGLVVNGKAQVAMFDGSVRTLSKLPGKETLNALITKNGGEIVGDDF